MSRLIDADEVKKCSYVIEYKDEWHMTQYGEFVELADIETAPTVDAVEVVRCKDCDMHNKCRFEQGLGMDGFCSQGERRDDGRR